MDRERLVAGGKLPTCIVEGCLGRRHHTRSGLDIRGDAGEGRGVDIPEADLRERRLEKGKKGFEGIFGVHGLNIHSV